MEGTSPGRAALRLRDPLRWPDVAALPVAALIVPISILAVVGWLTWQDVWSDARTEMARAAGAAAEYGQRTLESYGQEAGRINDLLRGLSDDDIGRDELRLHQQLRAIGQDVTQTELAYVIDRDGYALVTTSIYPAVKDVSLADRDYFRALAGPAPPDVFVSKTFTGRFDGKLLFSVGRRREGTGNPPTDSGFDGVVVVSVSPHVLADGMRRLLPTPADRMALMRDDGFGLSTTGGVEDDTEPLPQVNPASPFYTFAEAGAQTAIYLSNTAMPGTTALLAMHRLDGFAVYAVSVRPRAEIVAQWWTIIAVQLAFGIPATLALFALSLRVVGFQRQLAAANVDLQRDNDLSADRLIRAKRFGLVGTFEFDLRTGISRRSPEYMSVQGLPAAPAEETHDDWAKRLHPDDRKRAEAEVFRVLSDESGATEYGQTYRILTPGGDVRWIAARGEVTRDASGRAVMLLGAHVDVTPLRTSELALAESDARLRLAQETIGIGTWEWSTRTRSLSGSNALRELWGFDPVGPMPSLGAFLSRVHPEDRRELRAAIMTVRQNGGFEAEFRILRPSAGAEPETIWIATRATAISSHLVAPRIVGIAFDISERKRAEELSALLAHEVEHRAKNALTVVSGLLRMTTAGSAQELARTMEGRVSALSRTMGLLGKGRWQGTDLREILESELEPFKASAHGGGHDVRLDGPAVPVTVALAQPIAMAFHELATNAAKYGSLSVKGGSLTVTWRLDAGLVLVCWQERGGPEIKDPPDRTGFGSRLLRMLFEGQVSGSISKRWEPAGLVCDITFPVG